MIEMEEVKSSCGLAKRKRKYTCADKWQNWCNGFEGNEWLVQFKLVERRILVRECGLILGTK